MKGMGLIKLYFKPRCHMPECPASPIGACFVLLNTIKTVSPSLFNTPSSSVGVKSVIIYFPQACNSPRRSTVSHHGLRAVPALPTYPSTLHRSGGFKRHIKCTLSWLRTSSRVLSANGAKNLHIVPLFWNYTNSLHAHSTDSLPLLGKLCNTGAVDWPRVMI